MSVRDIDAVALTRVQGRQARAPTAPWLHAEVARRMAERLPVIRLQPDTVVDWWAHAGAGEAALARIYPRARHLRVEASEAPRSAGRTSAPWWSLQHWRRETPAIDEAGVPAEAGQL